MWHMWKLDGLIVESDFTVDNQVNT